MATFGIVLRLALSVVGMAASIVLAFRAETLAESTFIVVVGIAVSEAVLKPPTSTVESPTGRVR